MTGPKPMRRGLLALAAVLLAGAAASAQEPAPGAPTTPAPAVQAAPDSGPPPADAPAAQSPAEMPVDEGTVNDLPGDAAGSGTAAPAPSGSAAPAPPAPPTPPAGDSAQAAPAAGDEITAKVAALDPYVEDMQVVGPWTEGDASGIWRTVMVREADDPEAYRFFVQSLRDQNGTLTLRDSTEIRELAEIEGGIVGYRTEEGDVSEGGDAANGLTLFFDIVPSDGEIAETYELHFFGAGQPYRFGPASN